MLDNLNPQWERGVEFFISDLSQTSLTFLVYDWDGPLVGDDLLGATKLTLTQVYSYMYEKVLQTGIYFRQC